MLWTAGTIGLAVVAGGIGGYVAFHRSGTVVHAVDVGNAGSAAFSTTGQMNVLVLGTDSRAASATSTAPRPRPGRPTPRCCCTCRPTGATPPR